MLRPDRLPRVVLLFQGRQNNLHRLSNLNTEADRSPGINTVSLPIVKTTQLQANHRYIKYNTEVLVRKPSQEWTHEVPAKLIPGGIEWSGGAAAHVYSTYR